MYSTLVNKHTPRPHMPRCACAGVWGYRAVWAYGACAVGIVLVRTMKRVMFYEARQYSAGSSSGANYLLLALWAFQFPFTWWLSALPA